MSEVWRDLVAAALADPEPDGVAAAARRSLLVQMSRDGQLPNAAARGAVAEALLRGGDLVAVQVAETLALGAMGGWPQARVLAARAFDRKRQLAGQPQKFGTVWTVGAQGPELWPVDPATTDSERAKWGLPGLAELRRRVQAGDGSG